MPKKLNNQNDQVNDQQKERDPDQSKKQIEEELIEMKETLRSYGEHSDLREVYGPDRYAVVISRDQARKGGDNYNVERHPASFDNTFVSELFENTSSQSDIMDNATKVDAFINAKVTSDNTAETDPGITDNVTKIGVKLDADTDPKFDDMYKQTPEHNYHLYSYNALLKDGCASITSEERDLIEHCISKNQIIESIFIKRPIIRSGVATLAYYQLFDSILSRQLTRDYQGISLVLSNAPFIKSVILEVLNRVPKRMKLPNRGFLKSYMSIQRGYIQADLEDLIKGNMHTQESNDSLKNSLAWILETILMYEFARHHLIDFTELAIANMTFIDELSMDIDNFTDFKRYVMSSALRQGVKKVAETAKAVSSSISFGDKEEEINTRGVDFGIIINGVMQTVNQLAEFFLNLEVKYSYISTFFMILKIIKHKDLYALADSNSDLIAAVETYYDSNKQFLDSLLGNYQINSWLEKEISYSNIKLNKERIMFAILTRNINLDSTLVNIRNVLIDDYSLIKSVSVQDFLQYFNIYTKKDDVLDKNNVIFVSRRWSQVNPYRIKEYSIQGEKPYRRVNKVSELQDNAFILSSSKFFDSYGYKNMLGTLNFTIVNAQERSFFSVVDTMCVPCVDNTIHQYCMLSAHDIEKIAVCIAGSYYYFYEYVDEDFFNTESENLRQIFNDNRVTDFKNKVDTKFLEFTNNYRFLKVNVKKSDHHHRDRCKIEGQDVILTKNPLRILEQCDTQIGTSSCAILSDMISHRRCYASKEFMADHFDKLFTIFDTDSKYQVRIPSNFTNIAGDIKIKIDANTIWEPLTRKTAMAIPFNPYGSLIEQYCKSLEIFKMHIFEHAHSTVNIDSFENSILMDEMQISERQAFKQMFAEFQRYMKARKLDNPGDSVWVRCVASINGIYEHIFNMSTAFESGVFGELRNSLKLGAIILKSATFQNSIPKEYYNNKSIAARLNHIATLRAPNFMRTYSANILNSLTNIIRGSNDNLFNRILDSIKVEYDNGSQGDLNEYLNMFSRFETSKHNSVSRMLKLNIATLLLTYLTLHTSRSGDIADITGNENEKLISYQKTFISKLLYQLDVWSYEKFNRSFLDETLRDIDAMKDNSLFTFYNEQEISEEDVSLRYEILENSDNKPNPQSYHGIGVYEPKQNENENEEKGNK